MGWDNNLSKKQVKRSRDNDKTLHEYYVGWQEDLDYIILYETDLLKMLDNIRKVKNKDIVKLEQENKDEDI